MALASQSQQASRARVSPPGYSQRPWIYLSLVVIGCLIAYLLFHPFAMQVLGSRGSHPIPGAERITITGAFVTNGVYPSTAGLTSPSDGNPLIGSWVHSDVDVGEFYSGFFRAPDSLTLRVAGYPNTEGILIGVEDRKGQRLAIHSRYNPREQVRRMSWPLPDEWRTKDIRMVVHDHATGAGGWVAVSLPEAGPPGPAVPVLETAAVLFVFILQAILLFIIPGVAIAFLWHRIQPLDGLRFAAVALTGGAAAGYPLFWVYLAHPTAAKALAIALLCGATIFVVGYARRQAAPIRTLLGCVLLLVIISSLYASLTSLYRYDNGPGEQAQKRFLPGQLPPDNLLPLMFADRLYNGISVRPSLFADWKSSDRPPLQTSAALLQYPLWLPATAALQYQCLGIVLQCCWAPAVWIFLGFAGVAPRTRVIVISFCVFSGFFLLNSTFVWPKMLGAWLLVIAAGVSPLTDPDRSWTLPDAVLAGSGTAFALLSHGSVAFSVLGLVLLMALIGKMPRPKILLVTIVLMIAWILPWLMYQSFYDPPGDRLLKWHFAGVTQQDARPLTQLLKDRYGAIGLAGALDNKLENAATLFGVRKMVDAAKAQNAAQFVTQALSNTFFHLFQAVGFLNLGFIAAWFSRRDDAVATRYFYLSNRLLHVSFLTIGIWCILMFEGGSTIVHAGSYALMIFLFIALSMRLALVSEKVMIAILTLTVGVAFPFFVFGKPWLIDPRAGSLMNSGIQSDMAILAILALSGFAFWSYISTRSMFMEGE